MCLFSAIHVSALTASGTSKPLSELVLKRLSGTELDVHAQKALRYAT